MYKYLATIFMFFSITQLECLEYGLYAKNEGKAPITQFRIVSERASGSNYIEALFMWNTAVKTNPTHKHFLPWYELPKERYLGDPQFYTLENTDDHLFIVVFRNPYDWARSFHQNPHHASTSLFNISFDKFIYQPWTLNPDDNTVKEEQKLNPLIDRDPKTGFIFTNVFKLRTAKARNMLMLKNKVKNVYYIKYETVRDHPKEVLEEISKLYKIPLNQSFQYVQSYKGNFRLGSYSKKQYVPLTQSQLSFINSQLDEKIEKEQGYQLVKTPEEADKF